MATPKKASAAPRKEKCPTCGKMVDYRGIKSHMLTHRPRTTLATPTQVVNTLRQFGSEFDAYRRGYRDGFVDGKAQGGS